MHRMITCFCLKIQELVHSKLVHSPSDQPLWRAELFLISFTPDVGSDNGERCRSYDGAPSITEMLV